MKQHISKKQWDELDGEEQQFLVDALKIYSIPKRNEIELISIGQMIEFLGDDLIGFYRDEKDGKYYIELKGCRFNYAKKEPVDCLWSAVKYKLKELK